MAMREFINKKRQPAVAAPVDLSVEDALALMVKENAEALIVVQEGRPVGIFSTRDGFRLCLGKQPAALRGMKLGTVVTRRLITTGPEDRFDTLVEMMLRDDVCHLPVIEDGRLLGLLSAKDLMVERIRTLEDELRHLQAYVNDLHDAGMD